ncbi:SDR family oxidoreductase [Leptospira sp. 201903070]|uniref:dTDP-4-dehydrorhamnose reductase n=1 Tax=Leptospira ainlahdjerensis TaxID=2810033 RepID=A0ABS2UBF4_9LEPT|nr:SDR family oxidoreductase [Leptospira ainlahdjerensis]MBM9577288.1 SDR family oxidoreductase [Leptospira ainlahdjerensis]
MVSVKRILVLGASGMLGSAIFNVLSEYQDYIVYGTIRSFEYRKYFSKIHSERILGNVDVLDQDSMISLFSSVKPDIVINCIGIIKQQSSAKDPLTVIPINAILPHRLANLCKLVGARLILMSTDCVFDGKGGNYKETDFPNAEDLYGKSKEIGEISDQENVFTIRTSIIGHELNSNFSLVNWFLSQKQEVSGYKNAIFSGLPTCEIAEILRNYIIPMEQLYGIFHVSADPISKFELINLIAEIYEKKIKIVPDEKIKIDRSLNSLKFQNVTGYKPSVWRDLIVSMKKYKDKYLENVHV